MIKPIVNGKSITFGPCRLCYVNVFERKKFDGDQGEGKYQTMILIPKSETETVNALRNEEQKCKEIGMMSKWGGKVPKNYRSPLNDGDEKDDPVFADHWYLNAKSNNRPLVVDGRKNPITDPEEMYSGVWAYTTVSMFAYNSGANGVGTALSGVMKFKDDERLGGSNSAAADSFAQIIDNESDEDL